MVEHFKGILVNQKAQPLPQDFQDNGPLDYFISAAELKNASYILKPNKSSGFDSVSYEMIMGLMEVKPDILVKLFNDVFKTSQKKSSGPYPSFSQYLKMGLK